MMQVALIENIQREDLNAIEEAEGYAILNSKHGLSHDEIANTIGKNGHNFKRTRLLKLPPEIRKVLEKGKFLLAWKSNFAEKNYFCYAGFLEKIINESLSVRAAEALVRPLGKVKKIRKVMLKRDLLKESKIN